MYKSDNRDNSKNLAVRMTEEEYSLLQTYMEATNFWITLYFRKLIRGERITARYPESFRLLYAEDSKIYSNVRQIIRAVKKTNIGQEQINSLEFLLRKLSDEIYSLSVLE